MTTHYFPFPSFGPNRHSALVFSDYADDILRETGIDVYKTKASLKADMPVIRRLLHKFRADGTSSDEILDAVWMEYLRDTGVLSDEEQRAKDEYSLEKARAAKDDLRGLSDAPRFGYCKGRACTNRKVERLLLRGFCPDCRGITVIQTVSVDADATGSEAQTSIHVTVDRRNINPEVEELTTEERQSKVLAAKNDNPTMTEREIAELTNVPRSTVGRILRNPVVKTKSENSDEVKQFLKERAEERPRLEREARKYLESRTKGQRQKGREKSVPVYVIGEMSQDSGSKAVEMSQAYLPPCAAVSACPETLASVL